MSNLISKMKREKFWFVVVCLVTLTAIFDIALIIFDIAEVIIVSAEPTSISAAFLSFNIAGIILNAVCLAVVVIYLVIKHTKISSKLGKK